MVKLEDAVIARYTYKGNRFEVLVDPNLAMELRKGKHVDFEELLAVDEVFKDAARGERQSETIIKETFNTDDIKEIATRIITKGELQLTTEQRRELREKKKKEIIQIICRNAYNPQTKAPHPPARIEKAIEELKININEFEPADEQAARIIKQLRAVLPISVERLELAVKIPAMYAGKASSVIYGYEVKKQEWQQDGSLIVLIEIPAGLKAELIDKLSKLTHGEAQIKILSKEE
ncbi:MAG: ribosome assembly factor SBDS [Candidatus Diapherotrites archaeon]|nr:ribosome assembly factor SBDS [Candidatus Diapherotrites archaeon]